MKWQKLILAVIFIATLSFAVILESGDNGKVFAAQKSNELCNGANVKAVFVCKGNVVKTVSTIDSEGSTFYRPDGRIIRCPVAAPTQIGAECMQLLMPNYCPDQTECGAAAPTVFPGQNGSAEQQTTQNLTPSVEPTPTQTPQENLTTPTLPQPTINKTQNVTPKIDIQTSPVSPKNFDESWNNLVMVVAGLGVVSIIILFALFRKTLKEE